MHRGAARCPVRIPKPAKRSAAERRSARRKKARARRRAAPPGVRWMEKLADDLHSIALRTVREGCELAGEPEIRAERCVGVGAHPAQLQCAHGFTREDKGTRFDYSNTFSLCAACHRKHTPSGAAWYDWMERRLSSGIYSHVQNRARVLTKRDRHALLEVCSERLRDIAAAPDTLRREWAQERLRSPEMARRLRRAGLLREEV